MKISALKAKQSLKEANPHCLTPSYGNIRPTLISNYASKDNGTTNS